MQTYTVVNENIIKDLVAIVGNKYVLTEKRQTCFIRSR